MTTSHGIPGLLAVLANQQVFSFNMIGKGKGRKTSNVVLPTMGNKKSFIQLASIHRPRLCITPLGIVSDNKYGASLDRDQDAQAMCQSFPGGSVANLLL